MRRVWTTLLLLLAAAAPEPQHFDAADVGPPVSNKPGELFLPDGAGRFPAMVVLHGCDGVGPHYRDWGRRLAGWGYVALLVDSFRPRGVATVCNQGRLIPPELQAADGFAAAAYLRGRTDVRPDRIGVIGFSHGGWAVLKAVLAAPPQGPPFTAAVAFYPGCERAATPLVTDTLILIGDADDWTPAERCQRWRDAVQTDGHVVAIKIYPGALHAFDSGARPHFYAGHHVGTDPVAAADAIGQTRSFLAERLLPTN
ncbi:MAG TPA: dienelactone hydrolase family protein [Acetobacteraceae bacterium]